MVRNQIMRLRRNSRDWINGKKQHANTVIDEKHQQPNWILKPELCCQSIFKRDVAQVARYKKQTQNNCTPANGCVGDQLSIPVRGSSKNNQKQCVRAVAATAQAINLYSHSTKSHTHKQKLALKTSYGTQKWWNGQKKIESLFTCATKIKQTPPIDDAGDEIKKELRSPMFARLFK